MFGRQVTLKLKANSATELNRIAETEILPILRKQKGFRDETTFIAPERSEAIANSFWDTKADAEAYRSHGVSGSVEDPFECDRRNADGKDLRIRQFNVPARLLLPSWCKADRCSPSGGAGNVRP